MRQKKNKSIVAAIALTALVSALAAGCYYYDRDDDWGYHRYPERRYSYDYERDRDWRYRGYYDWRYDRDHDRRYSWNNSGPLSDRGDDND